MSTGTVSQPRASEAAEKLDRIRAFLDTNDLDGALFTGQAAVSWATAGADDLIIRGHDPGFVWSLVTRRAAYVLTQNIEGPRLAEEEGLDEIGFELRMYDWWTEGADDLVRELCSADGLANDGDGPGTPMGDELLKLRLQLTARERDRIRELAHDCCEVMERETAAWRAGTTERELAARIVAGLEERAIFPSVLLVGGDERRRRFRHPTVSDAAIERDVLTVIVGVRGGLHVAMSRSAAQGRVDPELAARHEVACAVEAAEVAASVPGSSWGDALEAGMEAYAALGYEGEWRHHYQGGPISYAPRDFTPTPRSSANAWSDFPVLAGQGFAWNPTVQGAKSEDTFLVTGEDAEWITRSDGWPTIKSASPVGLIARPAILEV
jgi:Xaa-Pro aminopeptidase